MERSIKVISRIKLGKVGRCIYCGSETTKLKTEHIIPYALIGPWELLEASCGDCEKITSRFETSVIKNLFYELRVGLDFPTRRPELRPKKLPLAVKINGNDELVLLPPREFGRVLELLTYFNIYVNSIIVWGEVKITSEIDFSQFCCLNKDCPDYGMKNQGNIVLKERYGKNNYALFKCKTCKRCFSETRGTAFFGLDTPQKEVLRTLAMIPEKGSIRGVARATGHSKDTICKWVEIAGTHSKEVTAYFLRDLNLKRVEIDEIWSYIKKARKCDSRGL